MRVPRGARGAAPARRENGGGTPRPTRAERSSYNPGMDHFSHPTAAERYAEARPYFHPVVVERMRRFLKRRNPSRGRSTSPAGRGSRASRSRRLRRASSASTHRSPCSLMRPAPEVRYVMARAEALPFRDGAFGLATVSCGLHWFEREGFSPRRTECSGPAAGSSSTTTPSSTACAATTPSTARCARPIRSATRRRSATGGL